MLNRRGGASARTALTAKPGGRACFSPMHVGDKHDRGENDTQVRFFDRVVEVQLLESLTICQNSICDLALRQAGSVRNFLKITVPRKRRSERQWSCAFA